MSRNKEYLNCKIDFCVTSTDYELLRERVAKTTCRNLSEYCRKVILQKPVVVFYRDQSFDDFIQEAIRLRKVLQDVAVMRDKEDMPGVIGEIKLCINKIYDHVSQNTTKQKYTKHHPLPSPQGGA